MKPLYHGSIYLFDSIDGEGGLFEEKKIDSCRYCQVIVGNSIIQNYECLASV